MQTYKLIPFLMVPVLALGCASETENDVGENEDRATAAAGLEFSASVGAVVVEGKKICTAALVDVDAEARIGNVSASGRQIVLGGACLGRLSSNYVGGAVFVTQHNGLSLSTPIVALDLESQASAGLGIGILSSQPADTKPLRVLGANATVSGGAHAATVLRADENGFLVAASVEVHAGVEFNLTTRCTEWQFRAQAGVAVGTGISADDDGLGAAAIVKVDGELQFAASIDGRCIVNRIHEAGRRIKTATLETANSIGDSVAQAGAGEITAVYDLKEQVTTVKLKMYADTPELRINGQGRISASANGASCGPEWLGACKLHPQGGFARGSTVELTIDTHGNVWPDRESGTRVFLSIPRH